MSSLRDKVALVTGAGQGIGQGIALALGTETWWMDAEPERAGEFLSSIPLDGGKGRF